MNEINETESVNPYKVARRIYFLAEIDKPEVISKKARAALYVIHRTYQQNFFKSRQNEKGEILIWREL